MYSESDLDNAIAAEIFSGETVAKFRNFIASQRVTPAADEECFRLLTGFNDIFVSIAIVLVLGAIGSLCISGNIPHLWIGSIAAVSWTLSEYFTRKRRMALPSILLLLTFTGAIWLTTLLLIGALTGEARIWVGLPRASGSVVVALMAGGCISSGAVYAHWLRFNVPITVAAGAAAAIFFAFMLLLSIFPGLHKESMVLLLLAGFAVFALALRWDMSDPGRTTRRADVAFWLHLLAAPLIVHPLFRLLGIFNDGGPRVGLTAIAIGIYLLLALIALLVDRRALMVSALGYIIFALSSVLEGSGFANSGLALTAFAVGAALLLLSASWHRARLAVLQITPAAVRQNLPAV
jgi:hypothetical protein